MYQASRKQFAKQMSYFYAFALLARPGRRLQQPNVSAHPARIGLTVGKAMGKAVERNRIRRRMREAVRRQIALLDVPADLVLHPKRSVLDLDFATLQREVAAVFLAVRKAARKQQPPCRPNVQILNADSRQRNL